MRPPPHNTLAGLPWHTVDWSQPNTVIARQLGCSHTTVAQYRPTPPQPKPVIPWHTVTDWAAQSNATIAGVLGIHRDIVTYHRWKNKLPVGPRSPGSGKPRKAKPPLTTRQKAARLEALWAYLWPDNPGNPDQLDEVATLKQKTTDLLFK